MGSEVGNWSASPWFQARPSPLAVAPSMLSGDFFAAGVRGNGNDDICGNLSGFVIDLSASRRQGAIIASYADGQIDA